MSDELSVDAQNAKPPNGDPATDDARTGANAWSKKEAWLKNHLGGMWTWLGKLFTIGVGIWIFWICVVLSASYFSGFIDFWRSSTKGAVRIETPQIYTRERLVNDRFREQAWLEGKLDNLDETKNLVTSLQSRILNMSLKREGSPKTEPSGGKPASDTVPDLVDVLDAFEKAQNRRAGIRRALIENELDDRHDIGANSLYLFNFGAAVATGPRSRNPLLIEMEIEQDAPLYPLANYVETEGHRCNGLYKFECAWLLDIGMLTSPEGHEKQWLKEFTRWERLFNRWLQFEISSYQRESDDVGQLLQAPSARTQVKRVLRPYYSSLEEYAKKVDTSMRDLVTISSGEIRSLIGGCEMKVGPGAAGGIFGPPSPAQAAAAVAPQVSFEDELRAEIQKCIAFVNNAYSLIQSDKMIEHMVAKLGYPAVVFEKSPHEAYDQFLKVQLRSFNEQCDWTVPIVEEQTSRSKPDKTIYQVGEDVETQLLKCIVNSIIRNFGSHPFGSVARQGADTDFRGSSASAAKGKTRPLRSRYSVASGLTDIFQSGPSVSGGFSGRTEFVGIVSREKPENNKTSGELSEDVEFSGEDLPSGGVDLNDACIALGLPIAEGTHLAGITRSDQFSEQVSEGVDEDLGWKLMLPPICRWREKPEYGGQYVDAIYQVPIGLFRFITVLSAERKTFSYSVQPRAEFKLEQLDTQTNWSFSDLLPGSLKDRRVSASGGETEARVEKRFNIIGFGAQAEFDTDPEDEDADDNTSRDADANQDQNAETDGEQAKEPKRGRELDRRAIFGWYLLPVPKAGFIWPDQQLESANLKLSALVSLPGWWSRIQIKVRKRWLDSNTIAPPQPNRRLFAPVAATEPPVILRVDLPARFEFLRNHFSPSGKSGPSLDSLRIPPMLLKACQKAEIVLQGERLWRSTVVTLGAQKARLIRVMPNMRGIIAEFGRIEPVLFQSPLGDNRSKSNNDVPLTIWTSEGHRTIIDTIFLEIPDKVAARIEAGEPGCTDQDAADGG